jgi:hypothetical protein
MSGSKKQDHLQGKNGIAPRSFLISLMVAILLVIVVLMAAEGAIRVLSERGNLPIRSIGNFHSQFEIKWFKLQDFVAANDGVDVLLMGNSIVNTGVDPAILAERLNPTSGSPLRVFNFGVEGLDIDTNAVLAELLVKEFHPSAIIYFTEMREYGPEVDTSVTAQFKIAAWFQYKLGRPSLKAWIFDHSSLMQYFLPYRNWSRDDFPDTMLRTLYRYGETTASGYEPDRAYSRDLDVLTDPTDPEQKILFDRYRNFSPAPDKLASLERILALGESGVRVFTTEMPIYPTYYDYFGGEAVHLAFLKQIQELTEANGGVFIPRIDSDLIPRTGRADDHHLNFEGTPLFSNYLADELIQLCAQKETCLEATVQP